jgi:DNA-binding XRE family transcriptional regulator
VLLIIGRLIGIIGDKYAVVSVKRQRHSSDESLQSIVGANIRAERQRQRISQERLAELAGVHRTYIGGIERGERNITLAAVSAIAKALALAPHLLLIAEKPETEDLGNAEG